MAAFTALMQERDAFLERNENDQCRGDPSSSCNHMNWSKGRSVRAGTSNQPPAMVSNTSLINRRPKKNKAKIADNLARACNLDCHANVRES
jgi:hypothetical protein